MSSDPPGAHAKLWSGRFAGTDADPRMERFTASIDVDHRLLPHDVRGSLAHVRGLARAGLLPPAEAAAIEAALPGIERDLADGTLPLDLKLEDIHTHVETALRARAGDAGGRLHTGRSRNDQVA